MTLKDRMWQEASIPDVTKTVTQIDSYDERGNENYGNDDDFTSKPGANFYVPKPTLVRIVGSDAISVNTIPIPDSSNTSVTPIRILDRRSSGVASKVTLRIVPLTGAQGRIYIVTSKDNASVVSDGAGNWYCPYGFYLGVAVTADSAQAVELWTAKDLYAVCAAPNVGAVGGMVTVCSEQNFGE